MCKSSYKWSLRILVQMTFFSTYVLKIIIQHWIKWYAWPWPQLLLGNDEDIITIFPLFLFHVPFLIYINQDIKCLSHSKTRTFWQLRPNSREASAAGNQYPGFSWTWIFLIACITGSWQTRTYPAVYKLHVSHYLPLMSQCVPRDFPFLSFIGL